VISILGGAWSGRKLKILEKKDLRPTSGRVKASIFSILEALQWKRSGSPDFGSWRCLDLFAGAGGLGFEALSRGAAHCVFVEKDRSHARLIQENMAVLGCESRAVLLQKPVESGDWKRLGPFDLVLIDPPYADSHLVELLRDLSSGDVLKSGAIILFEHDPKVEFSEIEGLELHSKRVLGPAGITVFCKKS
jgi:16S rRNA (guanine966-N2)-methyltransferase